jgi:apolipoprotein N-acyltransferase
MTKLITKIPAWVWTGLLYGLAYPSYPTVQTGWLAWFALVPVLLRVRTTARFGQFFRATFPAFLLALVLICWWLSYFSRWAMPMIWLTQGPGLFAPFVLFYALQRRVGWHRALWALPLLITVWEWAWLYVADFDLAVSNIGYTQSNLLFFNQFADLTGLWGLTAWTVGLNVVVALAIDRQQAQGWSMAGLFRRLVGPLAGWLGVPLAYSLTVLYVAPKLVANSVLPPVQVGLLQTNQDSYAKPTDTTITHQIEELVRLGNQVAQPKSGQPKPDLILAPEGAFPLPLMQDTVMFAGIRQYVRYWDTPLAIGFLSGVPGDTNSFRNEAAIFTPQLSRVYDQLKLTPADLKVYQKQNALAFGERSPRVLTWANRWLRPGKKSLATASEPYAFAFTDRQGYTHRTPVGICWEQMYPGTIAGLLTPDSTGHTPDFLTLIMNDGWFYDSPGNAQLLAYSQLRAIENRRSVARCSNQGFSGVIDPFGQVTGLLPRRVSTSRTVTVRPNDRVTLFTRYPDWFPIACGLLLAGWLVGLVRAGVTTRRRAGAAVVSAR